MLKQKAMHELRDHIRRGVSVSSEEVKRTLDNLSKSLTSEVLKTKDQHDGQNILVYAASYGRKEWFLYLAERLVRECGAEALVKELRELDINGTPLLFLAASSRTTDTCFQEVFHVVRTFLGMGGLLEQFETHDHKGRNIMMYAARGKDGDIFQYVRALDQEVFVSPQRYAEQRPSVQTGLDGVEDGNNIWTCEGACCNPWNFVRTRGLQQDMSRRAHEETGVVHASEEWFERVTKVDYTGKTMLHHAAEAASPAVLSLVFKLANEGGYGVQQRMALPDKNGRTPIMLFMRDEYGSYDGNEDDAQAKIETLWLRATKEGWMKQREIPPVWVQEPNDQAGAENNIFTTFGRTELFHAARGGPNALKLFLSFIKKHQNHFNMEDGDVVVLDKALDIEIRPVQTSGESQQGLTGHSTTWPERSTRLKRLRQRILVPISQKALEKKARNWGYGMLLAAAVKGGHVEAIKRVVEAIEIGRFLPENKTWNGVRTTEAVVAAIDAINASGRSLFKLAVMSGNPAAAEHVYRKIICVYYTEQSTVWDLLRGSGGGNGPLTFAASAPLTAKNSGVDMLRTVYHCLHKAARDYMGEKQGDTMMVEMLRLRSPGSFTLSAVTPLGAAALRSNWVMFRLVYDIYEKLQNRRWSRDEVWNQLPKNAPRAFSFEENQEMHEIEQHVDASFRRGAEGLSSVMWHDIVQAYRRGTPRERSDVNDELLSWRGYFKDYSRRAVNEANNTMFFDDLRELLKEGFPLHDEQIPELLENIEDHEQDVIDIVMFAVGNASNPLVMSAGVSKNVQMAETERPMHRTGLRRLQRMVDEMADELLDKLPHTVRGVGLTLLRPVVPENRLSSTQQRRRDILANLVGFIAVEWMLEPRLLVGKATDDTNYDGPNYLDPLQRAVDRGSQALQFVNNPLVLDYLHWKFNCSLPHWASRKPDLDRVNEGFYTFRDFDRYELSELSWEITASSTQNAVNPFAWDTFLLRFLQGWNKNDMHISGRESLDRESNRSVSNNTHEEHEENWKRLPEWSDFPRNTILPGLQFLLAGIIGKPETFYEVPVVVFSFELLSYLTMLILFCSCVELERNDDIPRREWTFYFFVAGLIWREVLEFLDGMPVRQYRKGRKERRVLPRTRCFVERRGISDESRQSFRRPGGNKAGRKDLNRMISALTRYILHDTWNLLDVSSIVFVVAAFIFRLRGLPRLGGAEEPGDDFFLAQVFLSLSTPLLFSRLLLLSQIDDTLGPMIQILWRLMSHTVRFAAFMAVVLTSFALAFHAVFVSCDENSDLFIKFGKFSSALLTIFGAALGEFGEIAEDLEEIELQCPDNPAPERAYYAGVVFLVAYLVVMAVVLLNLLIAVLSSEHQKVHSKGEMEFHMARTRLIVQNSLAVTHRRIPAPFNLIELGIGFLLDGIVECWWRYEKIKRSVCRVFSPASISNGHPRHDFGRGMSSNPANSRSERARMNSRQSPTSHQQESMQASEDAKFTPATSTYEWFTFEGSLQRFTFALTMGLAAVALYILLWIISLPWVAWSLLSWFCRWDQPLGDEEEEASKNERHGHFRMFFRTIFGMAAWMIALAFAAVLCVLCFIGSVILWVRGLWGIAEWRSWRLTEEGNVMSGGAKLNCPTAIPGQQRGDHWGHAWGIVKVRNFRIRHENGSAHFHISPLLKRTTGFDMERLVMLIKQRDAKNTRDKEFKDMDKEATQALFTPQMQYSETSPSASYVIDSADDDSGLEETKRSSS